VPFDHRRAEATTWPDLEGAALVHDVYATIVGASRLEMMGRLSHCSRVAATRYRHVAHGRDLPIAEALSRLQDGVS
jgi:hypothetical protein